MKTVVLILAVALFGPLVEGASYGEYTNDTVVDVGRETLNHLTAEQGFIVRQFATENAQLLSDDYLRSEQHIVGLLRANKWNKVTARKMLKEVLQWRKQNKADELGVNQPDPELIKLFPYRAEVRMRDGCPVLEIDWGKWLVADYILGQPFLRDALKTYNRHQISMWESGRAATKSLAPKCEQGIILADIKGFLMKNIAQTHALGSVIRMATTLDSKYANLYHTIICFNSPPDFVTLMKTLQPYLGQTAKNFHIYSEQEKSQAREHIHSLVDPKHLSQNYEGTK